MGKISKPPLVKLFFGIISGFEEIVRKAEDNLKQHFGDIDQRTEPIRFNFTDYYTPQMGKNLWRRFISFKELIDPGLLADIKILSNQIEADYASQTTKVSRPINLDPGYVSAANMVLASTKNYVHRIYLGKGIYAELEYIFARNSAHPLKWTYPDYRTKEYKEFFLQIRSIYLSQLRNLKEIK